MLNCTKRKSKSLHAASVNTAQELTTGTSQDFIVVKPEGINGKGGPNSYAEIAVNKTAMESSAIVCGDSRSRYVDNKALRIAY